MKVKSYYSSSTAATIRQNLDKWHKFSSVTDATAYSSGQNVMQRVKFIADGSAVTVAHTTGQLTTATSATLVALAVGDTLEIDGALMAVTGVGLAAGTAAGTHATTIIQPIPSTTSLVSTGARVWKIVKQGLEVSYQTHAVTLNNVTLKAHGINIYDNFPSEFFNSYTSYHYGGPNINTPKDVGALFIPFCLYPGTYQPSGHINVSRAREFYFNYDSDVITSSVEGTLVVIASAINFLLISDGSAVLRYST